MKVEGAAPDQQARRASRSSISVYWCLAVQDLQWELALEPSSASRSLVVSARQKFQPSSSGRLNSTT